MTTLTTERPPGPGSTVPETLTPQALTPEAQQLQRDWLAQAARKKAPDLIGHARRTGEKLHDAVLTKLNRDLATLRKLRYRGRGPGYAELTQRFHKGRRPPAGRQPGLRRAPAVPGHLRPGQGRPRGTGPGVHLH